MPFPAGFGRGVHTVVARQTDDAGHVGASAPVTFTVADPPSGGPPADPGDAAPPATPSEPVSLVVAAGGRSARRSLTIRRARR